MAWLTDNLAPMLLVFCFALLMLASNQLARIQIDAIGDVRRVSRAEAKRIYYDEYTDGDGATFHWREMRNFCAQHGQTSRLTRWSVVAVVAVAGGFGSVLLDQALR